MKKQENPIVEVKHTINLAEYDDKEEILSLVAKNGNFGVRAEGDLENIEVGDHVKFININDDKELDIDAKAVKVEEANKVEDVNLQLEFFANIKKFDTADRIISFTSTHMDETTIARETSWLTIITGILLVVAAVYAGYVAYNNYNVNVEVNKK